MQVQWHGTLPNSQPEWGTGRFIAMTIAGPDGHAIYAAWNTSHEAAVASLPERGDRVWRVVADSSKPAPFDIAVADDRLTGDAAAAAAAAAAGWTTAGVYPMLPWSSVVMELVGEEEAAEIGDVGRWDELAAATRAARAEAEAAAAKAAAEQAAASGVAPPPPPPSKAGECLWCFCEAVCACVFASAGSPA